MVEELVYVLRIEAIAPVCLACLTYVNIIVLVSVVICHQVTNEAHYKSALARLQTLSFRAVSHKLPMRVRSIAPKRYRLICPRIETSSVHVMQLHDSLEGQLLWVVVIGRVVEELGFDAVVVARLLSAVFEEPAHLDDAVVVVGAIICVVDPVLDA